MAYDPPQGTFTFASGYPSMLQSMWNPNQANVLLRGAVMAFESEHNMTVDASLSPAFWRALLQAQQSGEQNREREQAQNGRDHYGDGSLAWHQLALQCLTNPVPAGRHRADRFDLGELGVELGLVLCSVAILTKRSLFWLIGMNATLVGVAVAATAFFLR